MAWRCPVCLVFFAFTLRMLITHMRGMHSTDPHLFIQCNVEGCAETYTKFKSYYRHVHRHHAEYMDTGNEVDVDEEPMEDFSDSDLMTLVGHNDRTEFENSSSDTENVTNQSGPSLEGTEIESDTQNESDIDEIETEETEIQDFTSKEAAIKYTMKLKDIHGIKETALQEVVNGTDTFVQRTVDILKCQIWETLQREGINPETIPGLCEQFEEFVLPFDGIHTTYERNKHIKQNYFYVEPEEIALGQRLAIHTRNKRRRLDLVDDKYYYIPLVKSIQQLFQNAEIQELVFSGITKEFDGQFYCNITDGSIFQHHPVFQSDSSSLQIILYFDDIDICNPIGKKAGVHKLTVFYYSIANFPLVYRSRLPLIRVLAIMKRRDVHNYGIDKVLQRINEDLNVLNDGIQLDLGQRETFLRGALLAFVGDTLAAHEFGGYKEGVGFAFQKCRECECTHIDMQTKFRETDFIQRNLERYDFQTNEIANAETVGMKDRLSIAYGITRRSAARDFPNFNVTCMIPEDIMHVLFEGVVIYETKLVLGALFTDGICTLNQLNNIIDNFPYGYKHKECKPNIISEKIFDRNADEMTLKQSSSSMMVLNRLLPLFLVKRLKINSDNEYVEFIIELCEIVQIILAPVISIETVELLKVLISRHLRKFKELFPNRNIRPKQHYMIHLPSAVEKYGPLTHVWCMRFESKHQFIKQRMVGSKNYINVGKSIAERSAMYECGLNVGERHPLFYNDLQHGKTSPVSDVASAKQKITAFFGTDESSIKQVYSVPWVVYNGQKFIAEQCEVSFGESSGLPEFGRLCHIWLSMETEENTVRKRVYFGLCMLETLGFDDTVQAYLVTEVRAAQGLELVYSANISVPFPLHMYQLGHELFIPVPFDMLDLVAYKRHSSTRM